VLLVSVWLFPFQRVSAQEIPVGFRLIAEQVGVTLYRKDYPGGSPDYVQIVNLLAGASIDLLYGNPVEMNNPHNKGMFGGPNPSFRQKTIQTYWDNFSSTEENAFCVTNGQFFYMPESPTPLALPLLVDHELLAEGFGYPQYPEKQLMLALWPDHADILPLTPENLSTTDADMVIGGLTEDANKKPKNAVGRTFIGIWDNDGDQRYETIAVYTTQTATQAEAARTVRSFGAVKVMMLDGGGSTQLICQGQIYINTTRAIPQALGVSAGSPLLTASVLTSPPQAESTSTQKITDAPQVSETVTGIEPALPGSDSQDPSPAINPGLILTGTLDDQTSEIPDEFTAASPAGASTITKNASESALAVDGQPSALLHNKRSSNPPSVWSDSNEPDPSRGNQANGMDVLILPAIISPLSAILIFFARKQIFIIYRGG